MGKASRRKHTAPYRVRTRKEMLEAFGDRFLATFPPTDLLMPPWDERRKTESGALSDDAILLLGDMFAFKFGRPPRPGDPVFFDWDAETPQKLDMDGVIAEIRAIAAKVGMNADDVHAHLLGRAALKAYKREVQ